MTGAILSVIGLLLTIIGIVAWSPLIGAGVAFLIIGLPLLLAGAAWGLARGR